MATHTGRQSNGTVPADARRFDGDGAHGQLAIAAMDEHIHFVFETIALYLQHHINQLAVEGPKPRLGIGQPLAVEHPENAGGDPVAKAGFGGHIGIIPGKIPGAQQKLILIAHFRRQLQGIGHGMLPVGIGGDHPLKIGMILQVFKAGAQGLALAVVHVMMQHMAAIPGGNFIKDGLIFFGRSVIHHQNQAEFGGQQFFHIGGKPIIRRQGRNEYAAFLGFH